MQMILRGERREVELVRKKGMKTIRIRVTDGGEVKVSYPYGVSQDTVREFLLQRAQWLEQALCRQEAKAPPMCGESLEDGSPVRLRGESYLVQRIPDAGSHIEADHERRALSIYCPPQTGEEALRALFDRWWRSESLALYRALCAKYLEGAYAGRGLTVSRISVRRMTSRWGSCAVSSGRICLNYYLMRAPMDAIEYVLLHELTHLINRKHDRAFYAQIASVMPDWKRRRALLAAERCC